MCVMFLHYISDEKTTREHITTQSNIPVSNVVLLNSVDSGDICSCINSPIGLGSMQLFNSFSENCRTLTYIRECGSTLYVRLACTAPPTNTNFRLTFLLTRLQEGLYEDLAV